MTYRGQKRPTYQFDAVSRGRGEVPHTVLAARIVVWIVGTGDRAHRSCQLVLAASLLAVVSVLVQSEAVVAPARVRADSVAALVLTSAVVCRTLVHVYTNGEHYW